jgi:ribokinase
VVATGGSVLIVGSSNTDLVCRAPRLPGAGETVAGTTFGIYPGGKGANQAVAAARAGAAVRFVGAVGDDDFGRSRLSELRAEGIDTAQVVTIPGVPSGVALIVVDDGGENQIVFVPGANGHVAPDAVAAAYAAAPATVVGLVLEVPLDVVAYTVRATPAETLVVLNAAPFDARVEPLLDHVDILVCNETEAGQLLGYAVTPERSVDAAAELVRRGSRAAVITLGRHGAVAADREGTFSVGAPVVSVVDSTGAGDAFCGTLMAWLARRKTLREAVQAGVCAGSLAVTRAGAQPSLPTREEIERRLRDASQ